LTYNEKHPILKNNQKQHQEGASLPPGSDPSGAMPRPVLHHPRRIVLLMHSCLNSMVKMEKEKPQIFFVQRKYHEANAQKRRFLSGKNFKRE